MLKISGRSVSISKSYGQNKLALFSLLKNTHLMKIWCDGTLTQIRPYFRKPSYEQTAWNAQNPYRQWSGFFAKNDFNAGKDFERYMRFARNYEQTACSAQNPYRHWSRFSRKNRFIAGKDFERFMRFARMRVSGNRDEFELMSRRIKFSLNVYFSIRKTRPTCFDHNFSKSTRIDLRFSALVDLNVLFLKIESRFCT